MALIKNGTLGPKQQKDNLLALERLAKGLGIKVSTGKLLYAGLRLKGGQCILRKEPWLVLDRSQPYEEQLALYLEALEAKNIEISELPLNIQEILSPSSRIEPYP
ncbi:MAG: hypothetical protein LBE38_01855 [Deltaproteobacteria bacterium]|jgi:hypothetical protein|nr:hypothetical protein [Deltaproteobacteria bacterium]